MKDIGGETVKIAGGKSLFLIPQGLSSLSCEHSAYLDPGPSEAWGNISCMYQAQTTASLTRGSARSLDWLGER